ncbi:DUF6624 domain-containing protein [Corallococcus llansteffanensis]|uniref:DUF6624 domain-containing protein n=1 Tax=Corallococcus llansteffanensis TaxID=2316731 RepID=UPI0013159026|nr:DUF6624 domain-containing protein [Corallococcus llansteffanensis]
MALLVSLNLAACAHSTAPSTPPAAPAPQLSASERSALVTKAEQRIAANAPAEALPFYRQLWDAGERNPAMLYNAACAASLAGQKPEALQWLERAADAGLDDAEHLTQDTDLVSLRDEPAFTQVVAKVRATDEKKNAAKEPALRDEVLQRMAVDQEVRRALFEGGQKPSPEKLARLKQVDTDNTAWLKGVIAKHGWPGRTLVGERASKGVWLMVQHADLDRGFQKECLALMEKALANGEAPKKDFAYLTDRVLVGEGKPQRYGTQFTEKDGVMVPQPIEDAAQVDARRASMGLDTLEAYAAQMQRTFSRPASATPLPLKQ